MKKITSVLLCTALVLSLTCPALAAEQEPEVETAAAYLKELGVLAGDQNGRSASERRPDARSSGHDSDPATGEIPIMSRPSRRTISASVSSLMYRNGPGCM